MAKHPLSATLTWKFQIRVADGDVKVECELTPRAANSGLLADRVVEAKNLAVEQMAANEVRKLCPQPGDLFRYDAAADKVAKVK